MGATDMADTETTDAEQMCDLVKSIADRSADPDAAYEAFLLGLETARAYREQGSTPKPRKATVRKEPRLMPAEDDHYPTEWTLDS